MNSISERSALEGKDTNVSSRKGVFIPDITVEMFRNASLEGVEDLLASGEMEDISLPSAQPEIIRCTECKHYREYDSEYVANAVVVQCMADRYPISETIPDGWFCAGAERKDDE